MDINNNANKNTGIPNNKDNKMLMGILAYLGILILVPYFMAKNNPFVKFHIKQGLVLLVIEIIVWILASMFWTVWMLTNLLNLAVLVFVILGIVNVVQGREKELPLIGQFSKYFTF